MLEYRRWDVVGAGRLRTLESWNYDFLTVHLAVRELLDLPVEQAMKNSRLVDVAFEGLVVRYMRPFASGRRERLNVLANPALSLEQRGDHEYFAALRNRQIAHPVGMLETSSVYVGVRVDRADPCVTVVSSGSRSNSVFSAVDAHRLRTLCAAWLDWTHAGRQDECQRLLARAKSLTPAQLAELPLGPIEPSSDVTAMRPHPDA
jgi:hypothetical protein